MSLEQVEQFDGTEARAEAAKSGPQLRDYLRFLTPRRLAKMLYGIIVAAIVGEIAIAVVSPRQEVLPKDLVVRDKDLGFRMVPNYQGSEPKDGIALQTNSRGMREREIGDRDDKKLRVYVLGDSIVFGLGVNAEDAFPRALERELQRRLGSPVEVINGGVPGYGTLQEIKLFEETVDTLKPDIVLLTVAVFNDVSDNVKFAVPEKRWQNTPKTVYKPLKWLRERSQIYLMTRRYRSGVSAEKMMDIHALEPTTATARGLEITEQSLGSFAQAARKHGVAFGIVVAPAQKQVSPQLWNETLHGHGLDVDSYAYDMPNRRFDEYARREQLPLLDLLPVLRQKEDHIYENEHWNPQGHTLVAQAIADFLAKNQMVHARPANGDA